MSYVKPTVFRSTLSTVGISIFLTFPAEGVEAITGGSGCHRRALSGVGNRNREFDRIAFR